MMNLDASGNDVYLDPDLPVVDVSEGDVSEGDLSVVDVTGGDSSSGDVSVGDVTPDPSYVYIVETQQLQLQSSQRIESQNEALISILLIIVVVGLLHYIYKFFRIFI